MDQQHDNDPGRAADPDPSFWRGLTQPRLSQQDPSRQGMSRRQLLRSAGAGAGALGVGAFLVLYSLYALFRPTIAPIKAGGAAVDAGIGFLNGVLGGITGLAGILVTIWCGLRGWPKDGQRTVFQPVAVAIFLMSAVWIGARGAITADIIKLFLIGLPALFVGTWLGLKLFGRLNEAAFRKIVLVLLLASGVVLIV